MIRHVVLFTAREGVRRDDPRLLAAMAGLRALKTKIPRIRLWEVGENFSERAIAVDFALFSSFDDRRDLAAYVEHEAHRRVVELLNDVCTWRICDYEA